ncbi:tRNA-uridine aminocarboxypropyltransferase 1-like [Sycon ciliatum]|uniref:tRNA-uridine aminocarboxypropyltransferase 1-like n=1 Tax=Sycon ciliatum TaxID=27933 RepID=UPI0031F6BC67|eukprot:scpid62594/ scgid11735/ DTW domain-containing protein 1
MFVRLGRCLWSRSPFLPCCRSSMSAATGFVSGPVVQNVEAEKLFGHLKLASHDSLRGARRAACPSCGHTSHTICMHCYVPVGGVVFPQIERLPIPIDVIRCVIEGNRSTSPHAKLVCPSSVTLYDWPAIPDYKRGTKVILLFPSKDAVSLENFISAERRTLQPVAGEIPFDRALFIDGTWKQAKRVARDERLASLPRVILENVDTTFWRPQGEFAANNLATIEAIYHFCVQLHDMTSGTAHNGEFDNLLWHYVHTYSHVVSTQAIRRAAAASAAEDHQPSTAAHKVEEEESRAAAQ